MMGPITPQFRIFSMEKVQEFYLDYLGFSIDWIYHPEEKLPIHLQIIRGDCRIQLSEHHGTATPGSAIRIEHENVHSYLDELHAKDYKFYNPSVERMPWSSDEMRLTDPFGNHLIFFTTVSDSD